MNASTVYWNFDKPISRQEMLLNVNVYEVTKKQYSHKYFWVCLKVCMYTGVRYPKNWMINAQWFQMDNERGRK